MGEKRGDGIGKLRLLCGAEHGAGAFEEELRAGKR
jgi:hypothetical protein